MSKLKTIGRNVRRLRKQIAEMDPKKTYRVYEGKKHLTLTGAQWKASTKHHVDKDTATAKAQQAQPKESVEEEGEQAVH